MRLGNVVKCLGEQAEAAGVEVSPGFAGAEILFDEQGPQTAMAPDGQPAPDGRSSREKLAP